MQKRRKSRFKYSEGDVVCVPVTNGGFATGLIGRKGTNGTLLMYFFGPRRPDQATIHDVNICPRDACAVWRTSDVGIVDGRWSIIGVFSGFSRLDWPMPPYLRTCPITERKTVVYFRDDEPFEQELERKATEKEIRDLSRAGMHAGIMFHIAVENVLDKLLTA